MKAGIKELLEKKYIEYNQSSFIADDPVAIPHRFHKKQDIEIAGFFAAVLAWGTRKGIVNSCNRLLAGMHNQPHEFILQADLDDPGTYAPFKSFVHRTFNSHDLWHLFYFLQYHYRHAESLETAFSQWMENGDITVENGLAGFNRYVFNFNAEAKEELHCRKHIATPVKKSACKRLNMFLRWMVRNDDRGVDFGIWKQIQTSQLICPLDVHVSRVARRLGLLHRKPDDWLAAMELTQQLRLLDPADPVKYDYALFGLGVMEKY